MDVFARLPYEILIPDILFEQEFVKFSKADRDALTKNGVKIVELPEAGVKRVIRVQAENAALSTNDCFAYVIAEQHSGCILLTGDRALRTLAHNTDIETHGVLWALDEMHRCSLITPQRILSALHTFQEDETVRLPAREIQIRINKYEDPV